ncbi:hypothetical protein BDZ89DRAFT_279158 [Hymenopellis radicata]|nr:hypothetical protein BDZ89DRAFT_279158 [Hymenopellis radicata]
MGDDNDLSGWLLFRVLSDDSRQSDPVEGFQSGWTRAGRQPLPPDSTPQAEMKFIVPHVVAWGNKGSSPFLSTTTDFLWAMWDAGRRAIRGQIQPQILVIDSRRLLAKSVRRITESPYTLPDGNSFAKSSSEVLVKDRIPHEAVLAHIEWSDISDGLPPFFDLDVTFVDYYRGRAGVYGAYTQRYSDCRSKFRKQTSEETSDLVRFLHDDIDLPLDIVLMVALHLVILLGGLRLLETVWRRNSST